MKTQYVTRYMGSKIHLLDFIVPSILELRAHPFTFVDLMAGTHAVGYALRDYARVVSNDTQYYSLVFGRALITNSTSPRLAPDILELVTAKTEQLAAPGWFTETYADTYFAPEQCLEIETIRAVIREFPEQPTQSILLTALAHAMGYAQSSPGHFAQYMPAGHPRVQSLRRIRVRDAFLKYLADFTVSTAGSRNTVHQSDVHDFLDTPPSQIETNAVAYFDPPYSPAQYSRYYHLLDTVMLDDEPEVSHKGLYRPNRFSSMFCSKPRVHGEFSRVIARTADLGWDLVISYSTHALLPLSHLEGIAQTHYQTVAVSRQEYAHSMQGRGMAKNRSEVLLVCRL